MYLLLILLLSVLSLAVVRANSGSQLQGSDEGVLETISSKIYDLMDYFTLYKKCGYVEELAQIVKERLSSKIRCQEEGVRTISNAIAGWEMQKRSGTSKPLVLALTGSTGVGKSETAIQIAHALCSSSSRLGTTKRFRPDCLVDLRGET